MRLRLPGRERLIQSRNPRVVGRIEHELRIFLDLFGNRLHGLDKQIQFFFRFALRRFDHQSARHNQRKRRRIGMESVIDQPLGKVHCLNALLRLHLVAKHNLVH